MVTVTIRNLVKHFGTTIALDGVSLEIAPGELFFLLGPSGCGKTTLLRAIAGFLEPDKGAILFDGGDVTHMPPHKRGTAMVFQSYALWPHMSVFKNVAFGLEEQKVPRREIRERVNEALRMVRMEDYGQRKINQLSGGQQQRVALARCLVVRPRCLLLDEPLSNLDARLRHEMRGEIRRICQEYRLTAIYVTHDQKEALSIADRIAILDNGRFAQIGSPEDLYRRPHTAAVAEFIGETNLIPGKVSGRKGDTLTVETAFGPFRGQPGDTEWRPKTDTPVLLSIRPECLSLKGEPADANAIAGKLCSSVYLGETAQYALETGGQPGEIQISELNPRRVIRERDQTFWAVTEPEDVVILRESHPFKDKK